jgi:hypothetical protein
MMVNVVITHPTLFQASLFINLSFVHLDREIKPMINLAVL